MVVRLAPGEAAIVDHVPSGRLVYDGRRLLPRDSAVLKGRQKLMVSGAVAVTLVMDEAGALDGEPEISTVGLYEPREEDEDFPELETAIRDALHRLRSGEHTSELQSLMRLPYAVLC